MVTIPPNDDFIQHAKIERKRLLLQIEESQKFIERARELIARLDKLLAGDKE